MTTHRWFRHRGDMLSDIDAAMQHLTETADSLASEGFELVSHHLFRVVDTRSSSSPPCSAGRSPAAGERTALSSGVFSSTRPLAGVRALIHRGKLRPRRPVPFR